MKKLGGSFHQLPGFGADSDAALAESGLLVTTAELLVDPLRPLRSSLSTDKLLVIASSLHRFLEAGRRAQFRADQSPGQVRRPDGRR